MQTNRRFLREKEMRWFNMAWFPFSVIRTTGAQARDQQLRFQREGMLRRHFLAGLEALGDDPCVARPATPRARRGRRTDRAPVSRTGTAFRPPAGWPTGGTSSAPAALSVRILALANMRAFSKPSGLGTSARAFAMRVVSSSSALIHVSLPLNLRSGSESTVSSTSCPSFES